MKTDDIGHVFLGFRTQLYHLYATKFGPEEHDTHGHKRQALIWST